MELTRNASCVHEKTGTYCAASAAGPEGREIGLVLGGEIDLRLFYRHWKHGLAVTESGERGVQRSLQFFDASGTAVQKTFARDGTDFEAWDRLVAQRLAPEQLPGLTPEPPGEPAASRADAEIDIPALHEGWASPRDTHEFFGLHKRHGVSRTQALRLADPAYVQPIEPSAAREVLQGAAREPLPIMVFAGNPGTIQIHTGPVRRVQTIGPWLNVLDPGSSLHLREDHVAQAFAVRKPTSDGLVTTVELFDARGETIAMFIGERKPGRPELRAWRRLVDSLVTDPRWLPQSAACATC